MIYCATTPLAIRSRSNRLGLRCLRKHPIARTPPGPERPPTVPEGLEMVASENSTPNLSQNIPVQMICPNCKSAYLCFQGQVFNDAGSKSQHGDEAPVHFQGINT
ncbi:hypothetical protein M404DRAFT_1005204 [Pisolithus tinctorius Marx 270]|uniref:Uncharacterized protein n=1 Tax=Pisolithus tinctorius Marx 270 TaxID=870435 RepID=A0A0C3NBN2_PISTI|nr:hypothetical protein M404DRAFT_1005204 [Pisolithus tinctorius Marx 270]